MKSINHQGNQLTEKFGEKISICDTIREAYVNLSSTGSINVEFTKLKTKYCRLHLRLCDAIRRVGQFESEELNALNIC